MSSIKSLALFTALAFAASLPELDGRSPAQLVKLSLALHPESPDLLERTLHEVSDPLHPRYGKHLSRDEANALVAPREDSTDAVKRWLVEAGVSEEHIARDGAWIHANVPREKADLLTRAVNSPLDGNAKRAEHDARNHIVLAHRAAENGAEYRRRKRLAEPETFHGSPLEERSSQQDEVDLEKCREAMTPPCIRKLYGMPTKKHKPASETLFGIVGFHGQTAQHEQLETFLERFDPFAIGANFSTVLANGGENPQEVFPDEQYASGEGNLDIQLGVSLSYNLPVQFLSFGGEEKNWFPDLDFTEEWFTGATNWVDFARYLLDLPDDELPQVMSISYGGNEQNLLVDYQRQACKMFGQLGARGMSIIAASGDSGPGGSCQSNDGKKTTKFIPTFPASCPYVTTVGGTAGAEPEEAWPYASGGFSDIFKRPAWQDKAVRKYLKKNGKEFEEYFDKEGRGIPDIAAQADRVPVMNHGREEMAAGTSAAAPIVAAMIALINNKRFLDNKPPMGFLNPWIYQNEGAFTDITRGKSVGCTGQSLSGQPAPVIEDAGWAAVKGWDPVTGFGTPKFEKLLKAAKVCR